MRRCSGAVVHQFFELLWEQAAGQQFTYLIGGVLTVRYRKITEP